MMIDDYDLLTRRRPGVLAKNKDKFDDEEGLGTIEPHRWDGCAKVYEAIRKALTFDPYNVRRRLHPVTQRSVIYSSGRREMVLRALGFPVLFYPRKLHDQRQINEKVNLYLDVSGSMLAESVMNFLFGLILHLGDQIGEPYYQFTTVVRTVSRLQIKTGTLLTGGTDINPVVRHALQNQFQRILVISDGDFGDLDKALQTQAKQDRLEVFCLITEDRQISESISSLGELWHIHDEIRDLERTEYNAEYHGGPGRAERRKKIRGHRDKDVGHELIPDLDVSC